MKALRVLGSVGAIAAYPFIAVTIVLSPWFDPLNNALSDLGNTALNGQVSFIYNVGLMVSGAAVASFALLVSARHPSVEYLSWSLTLCLAAANLLLIGLFPENSGRVHTLVSTMFFSLMIIAMLVYGYCSWVLRVPRIGAVALVFGIASVLIWFAEWPWRGLALQEASTSLMSALWLVLVSMHER